MRSFFKFLSVICAVGCAFIFSIIYIGEKSIPDSITVIDNGDYSAPDFFGIELYNFNYEKTIDVTSKTANAQYNESEITLLNIIPVKNAVITNSQRQFVVLGGEIFGIKLYTDGVIIVDIDSVNTENGSVSPGKTAGIKTGDIVKSVNGTEITSSSHFAEILQNSKGKLLEIIVLRNNEKLKIEFKTVKESESGIYKAGLWIRDSTAGLGTVTFYNTANNTFGGLGHPIYDVDTKEIMPIKSGFMAEAIVSGLYKSSFGNVGELCGTLTGKNKGTLCENCETGIFGYCNAENNEVLPVAVRQEIKTGKAQIRCSVNNSEPEYYDVEITKIYSNSSSVNKDMIIKVIDDDLLSVTGGIVQGMSGSPIIQNGMLVGAVTHVFVNNPKQGYAIFAERMLETSNKQETVPPEVLRNVS